MAKYFQITIPEGASNPKLDSQGRATVQYTVRNVSAAPIDGRAALVSVPGATPANDPVQKKWVSIDGLAERHFDTNKEEVIKVNIAAKSAQPGDYTFRLDVASVAVPDVGDQGPPVKFTVAQAQKSSSKMGLWIGLAAVVVLAVGGVVAWLLMKPKAIAVPDLSQQTVDQAKTTLAGLNLTLDEAGVQVVQDTPENAGKILKQDPAAAAKVPAGTLVKVTVGAAVSIVPDLKGQTAAQALQVLTAANLTLDPHVETVQSAPENSDKITAQSPGAGSKVQPGTAVHVTQGAEMVNVPLLIGHPFSEAQQLLAQSNLTQGTITTVANSSFGGGVVADQDPKDSTPVLTRSVVNLSITPQTTTVPKVVGMTVKDANNRLQSSNLSLGTISGDLLDQPITTQNPAENLTVQVGTKVNVGVPCRFANCQMVYKGWFFAGNSAIVQKPTPTLAQTAAPPRTIANPKAPNGYSVDWCLHWAAQCGQAAADQYCRINGHPAGAQSFGTIAMRPTWVLGDNKVCDAPGCIGFTSIQCK